MKLTERQKRFVDFYIETANATESYKKSGYKVKNDNSAGASAAALLRNPKIQTAIEARQAEIKSARTADMIEVMEYLTSVLRGELTEEVIVVVGIGDGCSEEKLVEKHPSINDRTKAAEQLIKRFGKFPKLEEKEQELKVEKLLVEVEKLRHDMDAREEEMQEASSGMLQLVASLDQATGRKRDS